MGGMLKRTGAEVITMSLGSILITTTAEKIEEPNFIGAMFKRRRHHHLHLRRHHLRRHCHRAEGTTGRKLRLKLATPY